MLITPRLGSSHSNFQPRFATLPTSCGGDGDTGNHAERPRSVVLLLRHCEDGNTHRLPDSSRHCNPLGMQRAEYLAAELFHGQHAAAWPRPTHLYGLGKGQNQRQYETLLPVATKVGIPIQMIDYNVAGGSVPAMVEAHVKDLVQLCRAIEEDEDSQDDNDNQPSLPMVTAVAWKHAYISELARALGCNHCPTVWSDDDFDSVWQLHYYWNDMEGWQVYGSVVSQNFDPLVYQNQKRLQEDMKNEK